MAGGMGKGRPLLGDREPRLAIDGTGVWRLPRRILAAAAAELHAAQGSLPDVAVCVLRALQLRGAERGLGRPAVAAAQPVFHHLRDPVVLGRLDAEDAEADTCRPLGDHGGAVPGYGGRAERDAADGRAAARLG